MRKSWQESTTSIIRAFISRRRQNDNRQVELQCSSRYQNCLPTMYFWQAVRFGTLHFGHSLHFSSSSNPGPTSSKIGTYSPAHSLRRRSTSGLSEDSMKPRSEWPQMDFGSWCG